MWNQVPHRFHANVSRAKEWSPSCAFLQQEHWGWALSNGADTDYGTILQTWVTRGCQHLSSTCIILLMELGKDLLFFNIFPIIVNRWDSAPGHVWKMKNEEEETWISAENAKRECDCSYFFASERHILPLDKTRSCLEKKPADVTWWARSKKYAKEAILAVENSNYFNAFNIVSAFTFT